MKKRFAPIKNQFGKEKENSLTAWEANARLCVVIGLPLAKQVIGIMPLCHAKKQSRAKTKVKTIIRPTQRKFADSKISFLMVNNYQNIAKYLSKGIPTAINADEYDYHELLQLARLAKSSATELIVTPGPETLPESLDEMVRQAKRFIRIDWRR